MKKKRAKKPENPPQIVLGGEVGKLVWRMHILPLVQNKQLSTWKIADMLGVSAMTVSRWRTRYA